MVRRPAAILPFVTSRRRTALSAAAVLLVLVATPGCTAERVPDAREVAAREQVQTRVRAGLAATEAATSGSFETWTTTSTRPGDRGAAPCSYGSWDTTSYDEERHAVIMGTWIESLGLCAPKGSFLVQGDVVYVPTDETPEGRYWFLHDWAHVDPQALAEAVGATEVDDGFLELIATSELLPGDDEDVLEFELDLEALAAAGLVDDTELLAEVSGRVTLEFTGEALTRTHVKITGDGLSYETAQEYSHLNERQEFEIPEDPFLHPESPAITTAAELRSFIAIR